MEHMKRVPSLREQYIIMDEILAERLTILMPALMRETGVGLWLILCREYNEDPVFKTLTPSLVKNASRISCLAFVNGSSGFDAISLCRPNPRLAPYYKQGYRPACETQWEAIARVCEEYGQDGVYINTSAGCAMCDGLSAYLRDELSRHLPKELELKSAEALCIRWLETRIQRELDLYPEAYALSVQVLWEAYSRNVITPGVTTTTEVEQFIMQRINEMGLEAWFAPDVDLQRRGGSEERMSGIILEGDLLHTDWGLIFCGLYTDSQRLGYVLREGESDVPEDLKRGFSMGNRFQDIVRREFTVGRTGNEVFAAAVEKAKSEGLCPMLYTHPIGVYGHAAGPTIGLYDQQGFVAWNGEKRLHFDTCYALELNVTENVPAWDNQDVCFMLEETISFTDGITQFMDDERGKIILI